MMEERGASALAHLGFLRMCKFSDLESGASKTKVLGLERW